MIVGIVASALIVLGVIAIIGAYVATHVDSE